MPWQPGYPETEVRAAVETAPSLSVALRTLGLRPVGGNFRTLHRLIAFYGISTAHMDPNWTRRTNRRSERIPLAEILVESSPYSRRSLKRRLYEEGLKSPACEMCGQGEEWRGRPLALILDHINGVGDDNRLDNLRIVCPNCAATLETHCGRQNRIVFDPRDCLHCGARFTPRYQTQRYCSHPCGARSKPSSEPHPERRKVERPPYPQLMAEIAELGYCGVGRRYGVSDNAVRKWVRWYRAAADQAGARGPGGGTDGTAKHRLRSPP